MIWNLTIGCCYKFHGSYMVHTVAVLLYLVVNSNKRYVIMVCIRYISNGNKKLFALNSEKNISLFYTDNLSGIYYGIWQQYICGSLTILNFKFTTKQLLHTMYMVNVWHIPSYTIYGLRCDINTLFDLLTTYHVTSITYYVSRCDIKTYVLQN